MNSIDFEFELVVSDLTDETLWNLNHNLRLSKSYHFRYSSIDASGIEIGGNSNWPEFIDELTRAFIPTQPGVLRIRIRETDLVSREQVMQQIYSLCKEVQLVDYAQIDSRSAIMTMRVTPKHKFNNETEFTFGIVTSGKNNVHLQRIVESIHSIKSYRDTQIEIIVCGPVDFALPAALEGIVDKYIPEPYSELELPFTNLKKNEIAKHATHENLIVSHDRYIFDDSVIENIQNFGGNFDVCALDATDENGTPFPHWVAYENTWRNALHLNSEEYKHGTYLNGGIFLVKKEVLTQHPFNPLLFWGYGEDVEWSRRLVNSGLTPRLIQGKGLVTKGQSKNYSSWFVPIPPDVHVELVPASKGYSHQTIGFFPIQQKIELSSFISRRAAAIFGLILVTETEFINNVVNFIVDDSRMRFSLYVEKIPVEGLYISIEFQNTESLHDIANISYNGTLLSEFTRNLDTKQLTFVIETDRIDEAGSSSLNFELTFAITKQVCIVNVMLDHLPRPILTDGFEISGLELRKFQCAGWSVTTEFGAWTNSKDALIRIPIEFQAKFVNTEIYGRLLKNENGLQKMKIGCGSRILSEIELHPDDSEYVNFKVEGIEVANGEIELSFHITDPVSPELLGIGTDQRFLGFELHSIKLPSM